MFQKVISEIENFVTPDTVKLQHSNDIVPALVL